MKSRRKAREIVLKVLYQCDTLGDFSDRQIEVYFESFLNVTLADEDQDESVNDSGISFARSMLKGIFENLSILDERIAFSSTHWSVNRMSRVDRNILRLSSYELLFVENIPVNVTINEAVEIAKRYGAAESPMFVNGVLDNLARQFQSAKSQA